jgi:hypothetical protein
LINKPMKFHYCHTACWKERPVYIFYYHVLCYQKTMFGNSKGGKMAEGTESVICWTTHTPVSLKVWQTTHSPTKSTGRDVKGCSCGPSRGTILAFAWRDWEELQSW